MWEFIKYCLLCFLMIIAAAFGNNPPGITFKNVIVGIITMFVLIGLLFILLFIIAKIINHFRKK